MLLKQKIIVFGAIAIVIGLIVLLGGSSGPGLQIDLQAPENALLGVPFDLKVGVSNRSDNVFQQARLSLELPEGLAFVGQPIKKIVEYKDLGNIGSGGLVQESFRLLAVSGENSIKRVKASVEYLPIAFGARFIKEETLDIAIGGSGLSLDIVAPAKVFGTQDFEIEISYKNSSEDDYKDLQLTIEYPPTFNFIKSTLPPDVGNREWRLGDLRKGSENKFKITGNLIGPDESFFNFKVNVLAQFLGEKYLVAYRSATVSISGSPLSLKIILNENPDYVVKPGDALRYILTYSNNTDIAIRDAIIKIQLVGEMFDFSRLKTNASFRSFDQTLIWNSANTPELASIAAGESGSVNFELNSRPDYTIRRLSDKNFLLKASAQIESPTVPYFVGASRAVSLVKLETKVAGRIEVDTRVFFRDADSGILNNGPFPPRVGQTTQYIVHWILKNYSTDVSTVEIKAPLGPNVRMTGVSKNTIGNPPAYNNQTQEVVWKLDKLSATKGVVGSPAEAIFQIEAVPSQAGNYWPLIGITIITAHDDFTGLEITDVDEPVSTQLPDDASVGSQQGIVTN